MALDIQKIVEEFKAYDLDPGKIDQGKVYETILTIKRTLDLNTTALCRNANALLLDTIQLVGYKAAQCHYHERRLIDSLKLLKLKTKAKIESDKSIVPYNTKESLADAIEMDEEIIRIAETLSRATASRYFWENMLDVLHEAAKRVDSASASLGVEAKFKNIGG